MLKTIFRTNSLIWILAIAVRLYGATTPAQSYDIGTFHAWGLHLLSVGPREFFGTIWSDYLPLPILGLAPIVALASATGWTFSFTFKLMVSTAELILIFLFSRSSRLPFYPVTFLLLLSPALIGDTAFWGQLDSIPALLGLLSLVTLSPFAFGLAVALKPIMILLAPLISLLSLKKMPWWRFPLLASFTFLITGIPTGGWQFFPHLWSRVMDQVGTYPYASINAWNLWSLVPGTTWIPDSTSVLGLSARTLGLTLFILLVGFAVRSWSRHHWAPRYAPRLAATILILFYAFTTRMHERHLLFGLPFLTLAASSQPWLLLPLAALTAGFSLNLYSAYYWVAHSQTWPVGPEIISLVSWVTVLCALSLVFIWHLPSFLSRLQLVFSRHRLLVLILTLATLIRFGNLSYPPTYIFDEVYHAFTAREYLHNRVEAWEWWTTPPPGVAYEWTHPPVGKYGMVLGLLLFGENSFGWRVGSATAGVLSIWGLYLLVLSLTKNRSLALLASALVTFEGLHLAQSRIAMNDIYLLAFLLWSLYQAVKSRWKSAALLFGLALASKWSAVYGLLPLTLLYLREGLSLPRLLGSLRYLLIALFVYLLSFAPFILAGHSWTQFIELHRQMWYYHTHLVATHAYQSTPWQWLLSLRPVWYHVEYGHLTRHIYAAGNPLILWLGFVALLANLPKIKQFFYFLLTTCYLVFTLPWFFSPRIMFFYHYLPSSVFLSVILSSWLLTLPARPRLAILTLCLISLLLISPLLLAIPMPQAYWNTLFTLFPFWK